MEFPLTLYDRTDFWRTMTLEDDFFVPESCKASQLRNLIFCIIQMIIGHLVLARYESSNMRVEELNLLWSMLAGTHVDLAYFVFQQCQTITTVTTGTIRIGGMLTLLIEHFLGDRAAGFTLVKGDRYLTMEKLVRLMIIKSRDPPYLLKQRDDTLFPLPNSELTEVTDFYDRVNWKMNSQVHMQAVLEGTRGGHHESPPHDGEGGDDSDRSDDIRGGDNDEEEYVDEEHDRWRHRDNTDEDHYTMIRNHLHGVDA